MRTGKFGKNARGAALTEYGILVGLISVMSIGAVLGLGENVNATFVTVADELKQARLMASAERLIEVAGGGGIFPAQHCKLEDGAPQTILAGEPAASGFDCYDLGGGDDILDIAGSSARSIAYYLHDGNNSANLPAGNHLLLFAGTAGTDEVTSAGGSATVSFNGLRRSDVEIEMGGAEMSFRHGGKTLTLPDHFTHPERFARFAFEDGSFTAAELHAAGMAAQGDDSGNTIVGTMLDDEIHPRGGTDTILAFGGNDRIYFTSGDLLIQGNTYGAGFDTLDMGGLSLFDVDIENSYGTLQIDVRATGDTIHIFNQYDAADLNINQVVFADAVLSEGDLTAYE